MIFNIPSFGLKVTKEQAASISYHKKPKIESYGENDYILQAVEIVHVFISD